MFLLEKIEDCLYNRVDLLMPLNLSLKRSLAKVRWHLCSALPGEKHMLAYLVDAFTDTRFAGNPAGVVLDGSKYSAAEKQKIAAEIKASETAFVSTSDLADYKVSFLHPVLKSTFVVMPQLLCSTH